MRILVIEDERKEGHAVDVAAEGAAAYDLIVLDVMLPKRDGFAVAMPSPTRSPGSTCWGGRDTVARLAQDSAD